MKELFLTVRKNKKIYFADVMTAIDEAQTMFRQMPTKNLPMNQGRFRLDFKYSPKGEFATEVKFSTGASVEVYKTSVEELEELIEIEKEAQLRMAEKEIEIQKAGEDIMKKVWDSIESQDEEGGKLDEK